MRQVCPGPQTAASLNRGERTSKLGDHVRQISGRWTNSRTASTSTQQAGAPNKQIPVPDSQKLIIRCTCI